MSGLVVDSFAGGGGASLGIERALGRPVDIAINHDRAAIAMHAANHPRTRHFSRNVWQVDPLEACAGKPVALGWFSPDCKYFSKAKGGRPVKRNVRDLAWVVILWARRARPRVICLENVEEFRDWGPVGHDGRPCAERKGATFKRFVGELRRLGYRVEWRDLRACDYGVPTMRRRLFLVARCDGLPIAWPVPSHGPGLLAYRSAAECIDWSIPCPSIFARKRPLAEATQRRIAEGIRRFVLEAAEPFIVPVTHGGDVRVHGLRDPLRTVTCAHRGEQALVAAFLAQHNGGMVGHDARAPVSTIVQKGCTQALVAAHLMNMKGAARASRSAEVPAPTICAGGEHVAEVRAFLVKYYGTAVGQRLGEPAHTLTARQRLGLVTVAGSAWQIADIGMRMLSPRELFRAQGFPDSYIIAPDLDGRPLSKTAQVRMCGNAVCPAVAEAVVRANLPAAAVPAEAA